MIETNISYNKIKIYLKKDAILYREIKASNIEVLPESGTDIYLALISSIVSQQLSVKVARIIRNRLFQLFEDGYPHAHELLTMEHEELRSIGLSNAKAKYTKNLAQFSMDHDLSFESMIKLTDDEIIALLTKIKGIGVWTVQMMLVFTLDRKDVFPILDLGIQNGIKSLYNLQIEDKKELQFAMIEIADQWKPYRSIACKYIWKINDNQKK